jgi:hypothetical protein
MTIAQRIPTAPERRLILAAVVVPLYTWAVVMFFNALPSYLLRMTIGSALSILAYVLSLALIESLLVTGVLFFVCLALPSRFFKDHCVPQGAVIIWVMFFWTIPVHFQKPFMDRIGWNFNIYYPVVVVWVVSIVAALFGFSYLVRRKPGFAATLVDIADRLTVLSSLYIFVSIISLVVVIIRNLF